MPSPRPSIPDSWGGLVTQRCSPAVICAILNQRDPHRAHRQPDRSPRSVRRCAGRDRTVMEPRRRRRRPGDPGRHVRAHGAAASRSAFTGCSPTARFRPTRGSSGRSPSSARSRSRARSWTGSPTTASTTPTPIARATLTARTSGTAAGWPASGTRTPAGCWRPRARPTGSATPPSSTRTRRCAGSAVASRCSWSSRCWCRPRRGSCLDGFTRLAARSAAWSGAGWCASSSCTT